MTRENFGSNSRRGNANMFV